MWVKILLYLHTFFARKSNIITIKLQRRKVLFQLSYHTVKAPCNPELFFSHSEIECIVIGECILLDIGISTFLLET